MKKIGFRISLTILAMIACCGLAMAAETLSASVSKITGKVEILVDGAWVPAKTGQIISAGTTISTGFRSVAELNVGNAIVTVKALTRLTLAELAENAGVITTNLNLRVGKVSAEVKSVAGKTNDFKVKRPVSTASVRGTGFDFDGETIQVTHGTVDFEDKMGNIVQVPIGETAKTSSTGSGVVDNKTVMKQESTTVADAGADFGNTEASAFVDAGTDIAVIDDFTEVISFTDLIQTYQDFVQETAATTGKLTITIK